jgi:hypothetical protein
MDTKTKKNCFIIMPITTPNDWIPRYRNDLLHFNHVLNHLFIPAIKVASLEPLKPIAEGADNIPAGIIKNLESSDLVLCDFSTFNPNVFFELGIRTALDKPVCMVKDELTPKIPFDVSTINCQDYKSTLEHWDMEKEIEKLATHIKLSLERSNNENPLWKYYGIRSVAKPTKSGSELDKVDLILKKIENMVERPLYTEKMLQTQIESSEKLDKDKIRFLVKEGLLDKYTFDHQSKKIIVETSNVLTNYIRSVLERYIRDILGDSIMEYKVEFQLTSKD